MRAFHLLATLVSVLTLSFAVAKEPKASAATRDGSSKQRAIIVEQPYATYVRWEYQYLATHFPDYRLTGHAVVPESRDSDRGHDVFSIIWRGQKKEIWFDISKPFQEFARKRPG